MTCPICASEIESNYCSFCGLEYETLVIAGKVSGCLFNKGLEAARNNEITAAIGYLSKCVEFDKRNTNALDLLGLCYYRVGKINDALKVWILCFHYNGKHSQSARYITVVENNLQAVEKMRSAVSEYNRALKFAKRANDDMAIMSLEKAISFSPNFVDALNLAALCYIHVNENEKARNCIERALKIDKNNNIALNYYHEIVETSGLKKAVSRPVEKPVQTPKTERPKNVFNTGPTKQSAIEIQKQTLADKLRISEFVCFVVGLLVAVGFMFFLVFPAMSQSERNLHDEAVAELDEQIANLESQLIDREIAINQIINDMNEQQGEAGGRDAMIETLRIRLIINDAYIFFLRGQHAEAAYFLLTVTGEIPPDMLGRYDAIVSQTFPQMEAHYFNQAMEYMAAGNYAAARTMFNSSYRYTTINSAIGGHATRLHLANIAINMGDIAAARNHFEHIAEVYPTTQAAEQARQWLALNVADETSF